MSSESRAHRLLYDRFLAGTLRTQYLRRAEELASISTSPQSDHAGHIIDSLRETYLFYLTSKEERSLAQDLRSGRPS